MFASHKFVVGEGVSESVVTNLRLTSREKSGAVGVAVDMASIAKVSSLFRPARAVRVWLRDKAHDGRPRLVRLKRRRGPPSTRRKERPAQARRRRAAAMEVRNWLVVEAEGSGAGFHGV